MKFGEEHEAFKIKQQEENARHTEAERKLEANHQALSKQLKEVEHLLTTERRARGEEVTLFMTSEEYAGELLEKFGKGVSSVLETLKAAGHDPKSLGLEVFYPVHSYLFFLFQCKAFYFIK